MSQIIEIAAPIAQMIGTGVCGGLIVLLFAQRLASEREHRSKRAHFRSFIELRLNRVRNGGVFAFFFEERQDGFAAFNKEVLDVRSHICERKRGRFDDACAAYKNINTSTLEEKNAKAKEQAISCVEEILSYA